LGGIWKLLQKSDLQGRRFKEAINASKEETSEEGSEEGCEEEIVVWPPVAWHIRAT
jgi:hypothetical protein